MYLLSFYYVPNNGQDARSKKKMPPCSHRAYILEDRDMARRTSEPRSGQGPGRCFTRNTQQVGERMARGHSCLTGWPAKASLRRRHRIETCVTRSWEGEGWLEDTSGRESGMGTEAWHV